MIIGLTGGIGSGKSTVAKLFGVFGVPVYNSDERAKEMYYIPEVKEQIIQVLGKEAYKTENDLNKEYIASRIFNDKELLQKVNAIIHPAVGKDFRNFVASHKKEKIILKESALLFETSLNEKVDKTILVTAPLEIKIERLQKRSSLNREEVLNRINNQMTDTDKIPKSDFVIVNDERSPIIPQVLKIYDSLLHV